MVGKKLEDVKIVTSGAGAAAIAITKLLLSAGLQDITMCDRKGAIYAGRQGLNWIKEEMAQVTNLGRKDGSLADMLVGADVFIGVSRPRDRHHRNGQDHEQGRHHLCLRRQHGPHRKSRGKADGMEQCREEQIRLPRHTMRIVS